MSNLTLFNYLKENRFPGKIICIDEKTSYHNISLSQVYVPVVAEMIVDHVEIGLNSLFEDVVYVRIPDGMKWGDE